MPNDINMYFFIFFPPPNIFFSPSDRRLRHRRRAAPSSFPECDIRYGSLAPVFTLFRYFTIFFFFPLSVFNFFFLPPRTLVNRNPDGNTRVTSKKIRSPPRTNDTNRIVYCLAISPLSYVCILLCLHTHTNRANYAHSGIWTGHNEKTCVGLVRFSVRLFEKCDQSLVSHNTRQTSDFQGWAS